MLVSDRTLAFLKEDLVLEKTVEQRVLDVLSDLKPHCGSELIPITHRYSAVFGRLREKGYKIKTLYLNGKNKPAWYQLLSGPVAL